MEVFSAGRGCTGIRARRSTRRGSDVIGGGDLAGHAGGEGARQGFAAVPFFSGRFSTRLISTIRSLGPRTSRYDDARHSLTFADEKSSFSWAVSWPTGKWYDFFSYGIGASYRLNLKSL